LPQLHIITGSNGAGKSTVGITYLPQYIQDNYTVFDGDKLFIAKRKELYPSVTKSFKEARKIAEEWLINHFEQQVELSLAGQNHFVYEGHFTNESTWDVPKRFKENGYSIHLVFFGLTDQNLSEMRVIDRSKLGGHYVNPIEIDFNFRGNLTMLDKYFPILDELQIIDTSETHHQSILHFVNGQQQSAIARSELPSWFVNFMPKLTAWAYPIS
jgi:predicted ABC-type ATPase